MKNNLDRFVLDNSFLPDKFLVVGVKDWLDFNTKEPKGVSIEVLFRQEELTCFKVNILGEQLVNCKNLVDRNLKFNELEVIPYTLNGKSYINYSYRAKGFEVLE